MLRGSLQAEFYFGATLEPNIACFVHTEYNNCTEIDQNRKISFDYLVQKEMDTLLKLKIS